jgi:hypothetical protein
MVFLIQENKKSSKKATIKDWYWQCDASEKNQEKISKIERGDSF